MKVIASGSKGNSYCLENLMVEAGIPYDKVLKALDYPKGLKTCLVTHGHGDHAKYVENYLANGISVYATAGTYRSLGLPLHFKARVIQAGYKYNIEGWEVYVYTSEHDADEPVYFVFRKDGEKILFSTDNAVIHEEHKGLTEIYIEANYSESLLNKNIEDGYVDPERVNSVIGHMSFESCLDFLDRTDLSKCSRITLLHLSMENSFAEQFVKEIQQKFGIPVYGEKNGN
jgi:phosphoribosyl 1,2-cyclic phosphodiesterase